MIEVGSLVRVREPFVQSFPDVYAVTDIVHNPDDTTAYILGESGGFDAIYLELVQQ